MSNNDENKSENDDSNLESEETEIQSIENDDELNDSKDELEELKDSDDTQNIFDEEDREFNENRDAPNKKTSFFVEIFNSIENFSNRSFKKKMDVKKDVKKDVKEKKKKLKKSATTIADVQKQRKDNIKHVAYKLGIVGLVIIFITVAVILAFQDNEQQGRPNINMKAVLNDTTSFGGIDQKDYFLEQNVLDDKINKVENLAKKDREVLKEKILEQTGIITNHLDLKITELKDSQSEELKKSHENILETVNKKMKNVTKIADSMKSKVGALSIKVEKYKNAPRMNLSDGKIIFPNSISPNKKQQVINSIDSLNNQSKSNTDAHSDLEDTIEQVDEYELVEVDLTNMAIPELNFDTGINEEVEQREAGFEFDLTTSLVRVTLINGIKAPTLDIGVKNPTPVLMSIDGITYSSNNNKDVNLKGCLLRGVAVGNINTSRAEIFGTHLSCKLEGASGITYKVEHTFPNNEVWIKGEDGADGVAGLIVDSSGKILAKSAAIGFMQGLTNYFSAQNLVTGGLTTGTAQSTVSQLGTSMQSGAGTGLSTGFDLIISKYEEILGGYYPYIDVKGGRKNLTAIFGGGVSLKATPYIKINLENQ